MCTYKWCWHISSTSVYRLYERGYNPQIRELYPLVELPVRNTRMISPYIKWQHNRDLYLPQYDEDALSTDRIKQVFITSTDAESKYLQGHVVDGRNLFPATGYLFMVWDTLSQIGRIQTGSYKYSETRPLKFLVSIHKETGNFQITEEESLIVSGRIRMVDDKETDMREQSISTPTGPLLTSKDVYKELSLRGYNYKKEFRAIRKYQIEPPMAHIKWEDNWVTFIDNMLQMKLLETDTRLLYVPTYISKLTIDAKSHLAAVAQIPKDENEQIEIPVYSDRTTGIISCGGITITGLLASSINKRKNKAIPILEKNEFVPNTTAVDIDSSVRINVQIILENELIYKVKVVELMNELAQEDAIPLAPIVQSVIGDQPLIQSMIKILSKIPFEVDQKIEVEETKLSDEQDCNIVIVSNIAGNKPVLKDALAVLKESGYVIAREAPDCKVSDDLFPRNHLSSTDDFDWLPTVQESIKTHHNIVLYSENEPLNGILGLVNCIRREPEGRRVKCVFLADGGKKFDVIEVRKQLKKGFAINIYKDGQWGSYRHLLLRELDTLQCEQTFVKATARGDLSSLKWMEGPLRHNMTVPQEKELIYVHYATLNFRDVMTASGRLNPDSITPDRIEQECVQGFEFSGIDSRGRRVMGTVDCGAFTTLLLADAQMCFEIPDSWSLADAATVPVVYETVIYGMLVRGGLKRNETVLIHSGTGGVGQAAIRIALHYGCTVYTTVGTEEKREFLKKTYPQLEDHNIGNSRDESFEYMIRRETRGRGVDLVLNSLAEDKLIASVRCLARGGRFVEIGKFDMANNNYLNTALFEKEASFHGTMLDQIFKASPNTKIQLFKLLSKLIREGAVKPLNRTIFKYEEVEQAFRYMASGKHIGKVLVEVRKPEPNAVNEIGRTFPCIPRFICDPEKTYIILGGLGGFGLELADWLVLRGAKKLVLTSRKGISTGYQNLRTRIWRSYGTIVKISQVDITTKAGCEQLIEESQNLGPVDAIFNLAVKTKPQKLFATSFVPKAIATEYLDEITRRLCPDLSSWCSLRCRVVEVTQLKLITGCQIQSWRESVSEEKMMDIQLLRYSGGQLERSAWLPKCKEKTSSSISVVLYNSPFPTVFRFWTHYSSRKKPKSCLVWWSREKNEHKSANSVVDLVVNVLGLPDNRSVSFHATLPELGMDSMTAVEIKQNLEKRLRHIPDTQRFQEYDASEAQGNTRGKGWPGGDQEGGIGFSQLGDLFNPVDLNADSCKPFIPLKSGREGNPSAPKVLLFPGLEGVAKIYEEFTSLLNADVIGIQFMDNNRQQSIPEIALSLLPYAKEHLTKDTPFKIMAYSFGTVIALEVVSLLESQGYTGTLVCIDGSPLMLKEILRNIHGEVDDLFETALIIHLLSFRVSADVLSENQAAFMKCASWEERLQQAAGILKQHLGHDPVYEMQMINGLFTRVKTLTEYTPSYCKIRSTVKLFKAATQIVKDVPDDYGLSQLLEEPLEVQVIDGTHLTILMNKKLINTINGYLDADLGDEK
ncbi:hypothetical protein NQ317_011720 [Molorchus minor]|uniref:oleoyl-[acyl-carrier-protein] hydrolase n=1 Tax=Molorchus minor TaxID=1323400 RepID=A0ABQ9IRC3_9CUCU|nr:hypothetical protein NQ317_011720 [Molorchus minor]